MNTERGIKSKSDSHDGDSNRHGRPLDQAKQAVFKVVAAAFLDPVGPTGARGAGRTEVEERGREGQELEELEFRKKWMNQGNTTRVGSLAASLGRLGSGPCTVAVSDGGRRNGPSGVGCCC